MKNTRTAIAMIELIFSIVIMGLALLSAPMLISTATQSSQITFQQESIAAIASHTNAIMSYDWDEENTESKGNNNILSTATIPLNWRGPTTQTGKVRVFAAPTVAASPDNTFGKEKDTDDTALHTPELIQDDIDDFHGTSINLTTANDSPNISNKGDYLDQLISIDTQVEYGTDLPSGMMGFMTCTFLGLGCAFSNPTPIAHTSNVKLITTTLHSANVPDKNITLHAFMCNIGIARPKRKLGI